MFFVTLFLISLFYSELQSSLFNFGLDYSVDNGTINYNQNHKLCDLLSSETEKDLVM